MIMYSMKTILVLGSSGVVGAALCSRLRGQNYKVLEWDVKNTFTQDLTNPVNNSLLRDVVDKSDFIFFLAYDVGGSKYLKYITHDFINRNVMMMMNTFDVIGDKPCIFMSSQMQNMPNTYGLLKQLGEHYMRSMNGISIRLWNVYGPEIVGEKSHVITDFVEQYRSTGKIQMLTDGTEKRQFLHTDDCANALQVILENFDELSGKRKIIDVTNFEWTEIRDIARIIAGPRNLIPAERKDNTQTVHNEPDDFILQYWKPTIDLKMGIQLITDELGTRY